MNDMIFSTSGGNGKPSMMSTAEIAEVTEKEHKNVLRDVRGMLTSLYMPYGSTFDDLIEDGSKLSHEGFQVVMDNRGYLKEILLDREHTMTLVTGYDVILRKKVVDKLAEHERGHRPMTMAETLLQMAQLHVQSERRHAEQERAIRTLDSKIDRIETAQTILPKCPSAAEPITHIRERIGKRLGISAATIDSVMRQSPYAPKPAGMVKNDHADAEGSAYAVFWKKDVTATFDRFARECSQVTPALYTHPFVVGRFKMASKQEAA